MTAGVSLSVERVRTTARRSHGLARWLLLALAWTSGCGETPRAVSGNPAERPPGVRAPAPAGDVAAPPAAPGALLGAPIHGTGGGAASLGGRGIGGGGAGGLAAGGASNPGGLGADTTLHDLFVQHQAERRAREARHASMRAEDVVREGREHVREVLDPEAARAIEAMQAPNADPVMARCVALYETNRAQFGSESAGGADRAAFMQRCRQFPADFWSCIERGDEARGDAECRGQFARLDREARETRRRARELTHPDQRLDTLASEPLDTERPRVAPDQLTPEER